MSPRYTAQLHQTVSSAAVSYGYTLSIWGGFGVALHALGWPTVADAMLFAVGGAAGFLVIKIVAQHEPTTTHARPVNGRLPVAGWGAMQFLPAAVAVCASAATTALLRGAATWAAAAFLLTVVFLMLSALQATLASGDDF